MTRSHDDDARRTYGTQVHTRTKASNVQTRKWNNLATDRFDFDDQESDIRGINPNAIVKDTKSARQRCV